MTLDDMPEDEAVTAALAVMDAHIAALNSREQSAIAATLHFPHIRLSGSALKIWETEDSYFADFLARAGGDWHHSVFANIRPSAPPVPRSILPRKSAASPLGTG